VKRISLNICILILICSACKRYQDPIPPSINLTGKYCNIPYAVNYNWGFPAILDNTTCIYPSDIFAGNYIFIDSLKDANGIYLPYDTSNILITKITDTTILLNGICQSSAFSARAKRILTFDLDSNTENGALYCTNTDTINGKGAKLNYNDSTIQFEFRVHKSSGIEYHKGILSKN
jgi:hypothetical protein